MDYGAIEYSAPVVFNSIKPLNHEEHIKNTEECKLVFKKYFSTSTNLSPEERWELYQLNKEKAVEELRSMPQVQSAKIRPDDSGISILFKNGGAYGIISAFPNSSVRQNKKNSFWPFSATANKKSRELPVAPEKETVNETPQSIADNASSVPQRPLSEREERLQKENEGKEILRQPRIPYYRSPSSLLRSGNSGIMMS